MNYVRVAAGLAVLLVFLGASKIAYDAYVLAHSTTTTTTSTSSSTLFTSTTTSTSTSSSSSTSSTTYRIDYTTTLWGNCHDGVRNQDELGVDCGGVCKPCEIACTKDSDCGEPHSTTTVCIENDVYKPQIEYACESPWLLNASCRINKQFILVEKCPYTYKCIETNFCPDGQCIEARCIPEHRVCSWIRC